MEVSRDELQPTYQHGVYEVTVGSNLMFRFTQAMCIAVGAMIAALSAYALWQLYTAREPGIAIAACGLAAGLVTIIVSLRARDTVVIAQSDGLRKRWLLGDTIILWAEIESIAMHLTWYSIWYTVRDQSGRRHISWPVQPFDSPRQPQERGAEPLNPNQMAALVAQRADKIIQRYEGRRLL